MTLADIKPALDSAMTAEIGVHAISAEEAQIDVPFHFPDGDGFVIHVRDLGDGRLEITDKANTYMHLSYHTDVEKLRDGTRAALLERIRLRHHIEDRDGELVLSTSVAKIGPSVFAFTQALLEISDLRNLDREIVRSTFRDDLASLLTDAFDDVLVDFRDSEHDPQGEYRIPYLLNGSARPVAVFDVGTDEAALRAIVVANQHRGWDARKIFVAVEQEQERLPRRTVSWLSNVFDKQFSTLAGNEEAIVTYLRREREFGRRFQQLG